MKNIWHLRLTLLCLLFVGLGLPQAKWKGSKNLRVSKLELVLYSTFLNLYSGYNQGTHKVTSKYNAS